ncbi:hypothetical protein [Sphingomonas bacterium]|uniref:hypothetical protein n=1 Tax=Sphingomonas bacterium TaxID=1895847 RepID=UPI00262431DD|nr:hypothetical protein [Sphingomonas bacterium]MDB5679832.1 hypothetical protein [Sphingomonas bacterium]
MYQIIGVEKNRTRVVVATPASPGEALTHFRAAQNLFPQIIVISPEGEEIDGFELSRRYQKEEAQRSA